MNAPPSKPIRYPPERFARLFRWLVITSILSWTLTIVFIPVVFVIMFATMPETTDPSTAPFPLAMFLSLMGAQLIVLASIAAAVITQSVLLYRAWNQIQDGDVRTAPNMAIGFMFIPYFNLYWIFVAVWGLAKDLNRYTADRGIDAKPIREGLPLTACIMGCTLAVPFVNFLTLIAIAPVWLLAINEIKMASMAIAASG